MAYLYSKLYWKSRGCLSLFRKSIFKYKVTYPMHVFQICNNFSFFWYVFKWEKGWINWGNLFLFINHLMFSARQIRLLPVYWLSNKLPIFLVNPVSKLVEISWIKLFWQRFRKKCSKFQNCDLRKFHDLQKIRNFYPPENVQFILINKSFNVSRDWHRLSFWQSFRKIVLTKVS